MITAWDWDVSCSGFYLPKRVDLQFTLVRGWHIISMYLKIAFLSFQDSRYNILQAELHKCSVPTWANTSPVHPCSRRRYLGWLVVLQIKSQSILNKTETNLYEGFCVWNTCTPILWIEGSKCAAKGKENWGAYNSVHGLVTRKCP